MRVKLWWDKHSKRGQLLPATFTSKDSATGIKTALGSSTIEPIYRKRRLFEEIGEEIGGAEEAVVVLPGRHVADRDLHRCNSTQD